MASIELLDEETLNVSLSDDISLESNINDPESINVEQLPNDYVPSYTENDPVFSSSPAANIKDDDIDNWNSKSDFDGDYESLTNKPTIPTVPTNLSSFTDDLGSSPTHTHSQYLTEHQDISGKVDKETGKGLSTNDFTDAYKSNVDSNTAARHTHSNKSVLDDISSSDVSNWDSKQEALVSGTNIKTINNTSLLGSGNITIQGGGGGTATDVQINGTSITSNDVANIVTEGTYNASTNKIATKSAIPTKTSDLTNDSGFITSYTETDPVFTSSVAHGITSTDITNWNNKSTFSGNYNDLTNKPTIPDELSDLSDDSTHRLVTDTEKSTWNAKSDFSGSYADLTNKPIIPTKTSDLTNDSGFIDSSYHDSSKQDMLISGTNLKTINSKSLLGNGDLITTIDSASFRIWDMDDGMYLLPPQCKVYYAGETSIREFTTYQKTLLFIMTQSSTCKTYYAFTQGHIHVGMTFETIGDHYDILRKDDILNNLTTTFSGYSLDARQGKILNDTKQDKITNDNKLDYSLIDNTPTIPTVNDATLTIQKNSTTIDTFSANASSNKTINITVPTNNNELTNGAGYITGITSSDVTTALGYTPEEQITVLNSTDLTNINSTSDTVFIKVKNLIDNNKPFCVYSEDYVVSSSTTTNWYGIAFDTYKRSDGNTTTYSFCYYNHDTSGGAVFEYRFEVSGTSVTTTIIGHPKQDELVSGTNIKTINGNSILGSGNLTINASAEVNNLLVALGLDTDTYSTSTTYAVGDTVVHNNTVYECNTANTTGTWDSTKWDLVPIIVND